MAFFVDRTPDDHSGFTFSLKRPERPMQLARAFVLSCAMAVLGCAQEQSDGLATLLSQRQFAAIEAHLEEIHREFNAGRIDDIELRLRYRAFDGMPPEADDWLNEWVSNAPNSYFALTVRGYHHRSQAFVLRGNGLAKDVRDWDVIQARLKLAEQDMLTAMPLDPRPIMNHYVFIDVAGMPCHRDPLARYFEGAVTSVPRSPLLYNRQLHYLKPRWCGSREQMHALIDRASSDALPVSALQQMEAIEADDEGRSLLEEGRNDEAAQKLLQAAQLGEPFGWAFRRESLFAVNEYACKLESLQRYCRASPP